MRPPPLAGYLRCLIAAVCFIALIFLAGCSSNLSVSPTNTAEPLLTASPLLPTTTPSPDPQWSAVPTFEPKPSPIPAPTSTPRPTVPLDLPVVVEFVAVVLKKNPPPGTPGVTWPWHRSDIEVYHLPQSNPVFHLSADEISYETPLFSPDGRWMAYVEEVRDPDPNKYEGQARLRLASTDWLVDQPLTDWYEISRSMIWLRPYSWSPDSQWLAFRHYGKYDPKRMYIVNVETGELHLVGEPIHYFAWSDHDPTHLAYTLGTSSDEPGLYLTTIADLEHVQKVELEGLPKETHLTSMAWNPTGTQLVLCRCLGEWACNPGDIELWLVDVATLSGRRMYGSALQCGGFAWSSDGLWLANYSERGLGHGVIFYRTANYLTLAQQPAKGSALSGRWVGDLFLYTEMTNPEGNPSTGRNIFYQLVATSPDAIEKTILWHPQDVGLFKHMEDSNLWFFEMSWYATAKP